MKGVLVRGIDPDLESEVSDVVNAQTKQAFKNLREGEFGIVLGRDLARNLGVMAGDSVTLIAPSGQVTPAGITPRLKQMRVVGTFNSGHYEYDSSLAMVHVSDAAKIFRLEGASGVRVKLRDLHTALQVGDDLSKALSLKTDLGNLYVRDWTKQNRTVCSRASRKNHDVHHPHAHRSGGCIQLSQYAGDDGHGQASRHCDFAHTGRNAALDHGHFCGARRGGGCGGNSCWTWPWTVSCLQHRHHRASD
jgi:hypothetical protein